MTSDLVTARHLSRKAVIYIRQSTPHQVLTNQESLRLHTRCTSAPATSAGKRRASRSSTPISA